MQRHATAFITGASSGIGAAFATMLAAEGYDLILQGRREPLLAALCSTLRKNHGIEAGYQIAELSDPADLAKLEARVRATDNLEILVNNAGFGSHLTFEREDVDAMERMIRVHIIATIRLTHAALPAMKQRQRGAIINVSSVAAFLLSPQSNAYCASKLFLNSFSESLALELRKDGIKVQALCPGFTTTDFHRRLGIEVPKAYRLKFMSPQEVVEASWRALQKNRVICIPKVKYKLAAFVPRILPRRLLYRLTEALS